MDKDLDKGPYSQSYGFPEVMYGWEKAMATHSSTLAWNIPWTEETGRLQSMGSLRVGHNWATSLSLFTFMHWRRKWQPIPVFLPENPRDGGPWGLPSVGLHRVRHNWSNLAAAAAACMDVTVGPYRRTDAFELWGWRGLLRESLGLQGDQSGQS